MCGRSAPAGIAPGLQVTLSRAALDASAYLFLCTAVSKPRGDHLIISVAGTFATNNEIDEDGYVLVTVQATGVSRTTM